ncbi:MAG: hypothetical protein EZS28_039984, partial [Streblomastix strix]
MTFLTFFHAFVYDRDSEEINTTLRVINDYLTSYTFLDKSLAPDLPPTGPGGRGFNLLD